VFSVAGWHVGLNESPLANNSVEQQKIRFHAQHGVLTDKHSYRAKTMWPYNRNHEFINIAKLDLFNQFLCWFQLVGTLSYLCQHFS
jgi:hypothetical protein